MSGVKQFATVALLGATLAVAEGCAHVGQMPPDTLAAAPLLPPCPVKTAEGREPDDQGTLRLCREMSPAP